MWVRFLPGAQKTKFSCTRSKAMLLLYVRNRKTERGTQSIDWVASCGHDFSERRRGKSCGRFLPDHKIAPSFVRVAVIETASRPWQGRVLPLNHTRIFITGL